jgi:beta-lactamase regulating signal transducer with metallopeptidase domain
MFALREIAVSLAFFVLVYCFFSGVIAIGWRALRWLRLNAQNLADLLFAVRILPLAAAMLVTVVFVIPSFQILEPRSADEGTGVAPGVLGLFALVLIALGVYRVFTAQTATSRVVAKWLEGAKPLEVAARIRTFRSRSDAPPLMLVGTCKPTVLVSDSTVGLLNQDELDMALKHELAHMRSHDNLKKLVFRCSPFPGMADLEAVWSQTAELAADDAAVSNAREAVDLAAALVKLSRLFSTSSSEAAAVCTVGFVTGSTSARVARLLAWDTASRIDGAGLPRWAAIVPMMSIFGCALLTYGHALAATHELTEWLVR